MNRSLIKASVLAMFALYPVNTMAADYKLCLTGTLVKVFPEYGKALYNGAALNLPKSGIALERHYYDQNALAPLQAMKKMLGAGCHAILGFDFTNDLLAVRKLADENKILIISMFGDLNDELLTHPTIRTMQIPAQQSIDQLVDFSIERLGVKWKKPFIVTDVDRESMRAYRDALEGRLKTVQSSPTWITSLERSFSIVDVRAEFLKQLDQTDVVVMLTRSRNAAAVADMVYELRPKNPPVVLGTKFFGSSTLPAFQNMLKNKNVVAYVARQSAFSDPDQAFQDFLQQYKKEHAVDPMDISSMAADAVKIFELALGHVVPEKADTVKSLRAKILQGARKVNYTGITGVKVEAPLRFSYTKSFIIKIDKSGYNLSEKI